MSDKKLTPREAVDEIRNCVGRFHAGHGDDYSETLVTILDRVEEPAGNESREKMAKHLALIYFKVCGFVLAWEELAESCQKGWLAVADAAGERK